MSTRQLPDWLTGYLEYTKEDEPPLTYKKWTGISVVAAAMQRKCYLPWRKGIIYPNMYVVLVGPSGKCRKGTAMGPGMSFLRKLGINLAAEAITREALIRELKESNGQSIDPTTNRVYGHCSLTIYSQELTVFLGYNNLQLMSDLTDWFDCRDRWTYRTKNMGTDEIHGVWVNLIGATTPDLIQSTLPREAIGGGLTSRMIFVYEDTKSQVSPLPYFTQEDEELEGKLFHDLEAISTMMGSFTYDESWLERWIEWYLHSEENPPFTDDRLFGYVQRRADYIRKLSMIFNASRDGKRKLEVQDIERAIATLQEVERKMPYAFAGVGKNPLAEVMARVIGTLKEKKEMTIGELLNIYYYDVTKDDLGNIIAVLEARGLVRLRIAGNESTIVYTGRNTDG